MLLISVFIKQNNSLTKYMQITYTWHTFDKIITKLILINYVSTYYETLLKEA